MFVKHLTYTSQTPHVSPHITLHLELRFGDLRIQVSSEGLSEEYVRCMWGVQETLNIVKWLSSFMLRSECEVLGFFFVFWGLLKFRMFMLVGLSKHECPWMNHEFYAQQFNGQLHGNYMLKRTSSTAKWLQKPAKTHFYLKASFCRLRQRGFIWMLPSARCESGDSFECCLSQAAKARIHLNVAFCTLR